MKKPNGPKILVLDTETAPIIGAFWRLFDENIGLNQIQKDWHLLSFAAIWLDDPDSKIVYMDQRNEKNIEDDSKLLKKLWDLLNDAEIVISHNGNSFDIKKINARMALAGMKPPSPFKNIDTYQIVKRKFGFTSNKLAYLTDKFCTKYKKLEHGNFPGFDLWRECLKGNRQAWNEMKRYNINDVLSLRELYHKLIPWDNTINFSAYDDEIVQVCSCGSTEFEKRGFHYTSTGKFQRFQCKKCGKWTHDRTNLFSKEKRKSLRAGTR